MLFPHPGGPVMPIMYAFPVRQYRLDRIEILARGSFSADEISREMALLSPFAALRTKRSIVEFGMGS